MRITRDEMLMAMAHMAAERGTCNRLHVGALLAVDSRPISIGYNGAPAGEAHCGSDCNQDQPCKNTLHAEWNALDWAFHYLDVVFIPGSTMYVTHSPCLECAKHLYRAGVERVVFDIPYRLTTGIDWLRERGVEVVQCHAKHVTNASSVNMPTIRVSKESAPSLPE